MVEEMMWKRAGRFSRGPLALANQHYSRQKPWSPQFVKTGACLVLVYGDDEHPERFLQDGAYWTTSLQAWIKHAWPGTIECSAFRRQPGCPYKATEMITAAIAATRHWINSEKDMAEPLPMITFIDTEKVKPTMVHGKPVWGWTYRRVGFVEIGMLRTKLVLELPVDKWPDAAPAIGAKLALF